MGRRLPPTSSRRSLHSRLPNSFGSLAKMGSQRQVSLQAISWLQWGKSSPQRAGRTTLALFQKLSSVARASGSDAIPLRMLAALMPRNLPQSVPPLLRFFFGSFAFNLVLQAIVANAPSSPPTNSAHEAPTPAQLPKTPPPRPDSPANSESEFSPAHRTRPGSKRQTKFS